MYRPGENIYDVRQKGIPWLAAAIVIVIISLVACLLFVLLDSRFDVSVPNTAVSSTEEPTIIFTSTDISPTVASTTESASVKTTTSAPEVNPTTLRNFEELKGMNVEKTSRKFKKALVASSSEFCSEIGRNVFLNGGNAIDAVIATEICVGGLEPNSAGLGGGHILLMHNGNSTIVINGQSRAPRSVTENTYSTIPDLSIEGYASIAVPGELHALWTAYKRFGSGRVSWQSLLWPTAELLEKGYPMSSSMSSALLSVSPDFRRAASKNIPISAEEGDLLKNEALADTLRRLAQSRDPVHLFYKGEMGNHIVNEMKSRGGLITKLDLVSYESLVQEPLVAKMTDDFLLLGPSPPSVFAAVPLAVRLSLRNAEQNSTFQYIQTAFSKIGDPQFVPETASDAANMTNESNLTIFEESDDQPRSQKQMWPKINTIIAADASGSVAILTSSLFSSFGSQRLSDKLGFVWNNEMGAFDLQRNDNEEEDRNSVQGSKRPRTSLAPMLLLKNGKWKEATSAPADQEDIQIIVDHLLSKTKITKDSENKWFGVENNEKELYPICDTPNVLLCSSSRGF